MAQRNRPQNRIKPEQHPDCFFFVFFCSFFYSDLPGGLQWEEWKLLQTWRVCVSMNNYPTKSWHSCWLFFFFWWKEIHGIRNCASHILMERRVFGVSFNLLAVYRSLSTIFSPSHTLRSNVINQIGIFLYYRLDVHLNKFCFNRHLLRDVDRITGWPLRFPCSLLSLPRLTHSLTRSLAAEDNSHTLSRSLRAIPDQSYLALFSRTQIHHCWIGPKLKSNPLDAQEKT